MNHGGQMNRTWVKKQAKKYGMTEKQFLAFLAASGMLR
tara:strand:- start:108 stop:221 length:114 start_codon:yes stop_codon:yes gene_type:complete